MPNNLTILIGRISKAFSLITVCLVGAAHAAPLEEIIVTAQKRAQSLQDVPLSMTCLLYTSPSPRDSDSSRMPSSA